MVYGSDIATANFLAVVDYHRPALDVRGFDIATDPADYLEWEPRSVHLEMWDVDEIAVSWVETEDASDRAVCGLAEGSFKACDCTRG